MLNLQYYQERTPHPRPAPMIPRTSRTLHSHARAHREKGARARVERRACSIRAHDPQGARGGIRRRRAKRRPSYGRPKDATPAHPFPQAHSSTQTRDRRLKKIHLLSSPLLAPARSPTTLRTPPSPPPPSGRRACRRSSVRRAPCGCRRGHTHHAAPSPPTRALRQPSP